MVDQGRLVEEFDRFVDLVIRDYAVTDALHDLVDGITATLGIEGAGISLARDGRLVSATAASRSAALLERAQEASATGPCEDAFRDGAPVFVDDIAATPDRWPRFAGAATAAGVHAVAGIPMRVNGTCIGALDLYDTRPRHWTDEDAAAARRFAALATGYVANASRVDRLRHTADQLQVALESRVVIEQAKGILAGERQISVEQAFDALRRHARSNGASLRAVADAVVHLGLRPA